VEQFLCGFKTNIKQTRIPTKEFSPLTMKLTSSMVRKFGPVSDKGKGKVVPMLLLTEHHVMKAHWGGKV
jgi:hypothetical protein